jgi:hypothetical protein
MGSWLHRVLNYKLSVAVLIEIWLWFLIPYVTFGLFWSAFHPAYANQIQAHLLSGLPAGSDIAAYIDAALLWPVLLFGSGICPT